MKKFSIIIVILIVVVGLGIYLGSKDSHPVVTNDLKSVPSDNALQNNMSKAGLDVLSAEGTVLHIHQHIDIIINGRIYTPPADLGIGSNFISPIHIHDEAGIIHVESPVKKDFTLSQFFDEWGVTFNDNCIATYCSDAGNKLVVAVNGNPITNVRSYVLKAHDEIEVWYGSKNQSPSFIKSYNFPAGL